MMEHRSPSARDEHHPRGVMPLGSQRRGTCPADYPGAWDAGRQGLGSPRRREPASRVGPPTDSAVGR